MAQSSVESETVGAAASADRARERRSIYALLGALAVVSAFWLASDLYLEASDPWLYAREAFRLASGTLVKEADAGHPFPHRIGLLIPTAIAYRLLGVSAQSSLLFPLGCGLAFCAIAYFSFRQTSARVLALIVAVTCFPVVRATTQLGTDLPVAAWMGMTALLLSGRDGSLSPWLGGARIGVLAALTAFFAFLTKESAIWLGPVIAGVLARDGWTGDWRRNRMFYIAFGLVGGACI